MMALKPDLSSTAGVQNVVVYVSNDNFAQSYAIEQHNVSQQSNVYPNSNHSMASMAQTKNFTDKDQNIFTSSSQVINTSDYFDNVIAQNGFSINNIGPYQSGANIKTSEVLTCDRQQAGPVQPENNRRDECDNLEQYTDPYVTILGTEVPSQSVRCDSVRSETAESSCSSLSSGDEGMVVVQNHPPEMVVYDPSVSVRPGGVVLVGPPPQPVPHQQAQAAPVVGMGQPQYTVVPYGWKRLLNNGSVIYISPSNTALSSLEQVKKYLLTSGTCKCGLECHFKYDTVFNFDNKVIAKPWVLSPDTNTGDLTKLCNHKRKIMAMASSLACKPPDLEDKMRKDYGLKKKRKIGLTPSGGISVSQILAQREKLVMEQQAYNKDIVSNQPPPPQLWSSNNPVGHTHMQGFIENQQNLVRCHDQPGNSITHGSPIIGSDSNIGGLQHGAQPSNIQNQQQILAPNGQLINVQEIPHSNQNMMHQEQNQMLHGPTVMQSQTQHNRIYLNTQPSEPSGPGRPGMHQLGPSNSMNSLPQQIQGSEMPKRMHHHQQQQMFNSQQMQHFENVDAGKSIRPFGFNNVRPQMMPTHGANNLLQMQQQQMQQQKLQWQHKMQTINQQQQQINQMHMQQQQNMQENQNVYERVPPLHQHPNPVWQEEMRRKKVKLSKIFKNRQYHMVENPQIRGGTGPCPNIDVRQIPNENSRPVVVNQMLQHSHNNTASPSFMEDPSGYLAQQTALLNNTINRQTCATNNMGYRSNNNPNISTQDPTHNMIAVPNSQMGEVPLPSNVNLKPQLTRINQQNVPQMRQPQMHHHHLQKVHFNQTDQHQQQNVVDSSVLNDQHFMQQCQGCVSDAPSFIQNNRKVKQLSRSDSAPSTPSSCSTSEDPVTSSMFPEKHVSQPSPDTRPIQGGTVSTSNVSPMDSIHSDPPTPNPHTTAPTPPQKTVEPMQNMNLFSIQNHDGQLVQIVSQSRENYVQHQEHEQNFQQKTQSKLENSYVYSHSSQNISKFNEQRGPLPNVVTTMASSRTSGSNTITSVLAGRTNTATVSLSSSGKQPGSETPPVNSMNLQPMQPININVSKSPLEMVQSVVSSIQVPQSQQQPQQQQQRITVSIAHSSPQMSPQLVKHSPTGLPPGHILVSSNGQLIMASPGGGQTNVMAPPPPPKVASSQHAMPPISVSPMVTNVTAAVSQVIPQQVLGQQTVLVNTLPTPFVIQPGVTMTLDGMAVGQNMQIPQIVTGNVIQQQIQLDNNDSRRAPNILSPETKKKGKKRKLPSQTVAGMLHIAAQQNSGMVVNQQGFPQQIQVAHSPQGITTTPMMQALTIVPSKTGGPPQIVMNGQAVANTNIGTQQIITNSQPTQQINLLQPVSLLNGTTGVVQNIPIQQFIVPNIGSSMVMNADGTATILQDTSNLGMHLQIQNVNGQNVLTPIQNNQVFSSGQNILAAGPAGMVIRAPTSQGKIIQQQHSPGAQFLSPNGGQFVVNGAQFSGQLSPLVASVSPSQQVTFNTSPQQIRQNNQLQSNQQEYIQVNGQMGQTLVVPCSPQTSNIASSSSNQQNTTFVQQNTTIVQQQTTMVANNQQLQSFQQNNQQGQQNLARSSAMNVGQQNFMINTNDNKNQVRTLLVQQQRSTSHEDINYRQSVSTQTAVNQNSQSVTTNSFCQTSTLSASSPPDTTTLSPVASGGQSPPTADTTTHTGGSTDEGLSPAPSSCSTFSELNIPGRPGSRTMAMVHCVSSSEPDLLDPPNTQSDQEWRKISQASSSTKEEFVAMKQEFTDITSAHQMRYNRKQQNIGHMTYEEPGMQYMDQKMKQDHNMAAKHYGRMMQKRTNDMMLVMDTRHMLFDGEEDDVVEN
ncbi:uncharacterized protein LOC126744869 isoform X2 [Anthonomus grandis grandis]|uniref:uncharacterized protein LOC126744869 isoform X2 n=1 Tax=Anthonomus grandis grandis TaxID=2921223 RepID=UPI0021661775|nr:uncharacterized protein LOC126744869 isoform X2 [Anthonomus grandis grandis]